MGPPAGRSIALYPSSDTRLEPLPALGLDSQLYVDAGVDAVWYAVLHGEEPDELVDWYPVGLSLKVAGLLKGAILSCSSSWVESSTPLIMPPFED